MRRVLILCTGNSCRSQMAEALLNHWGRGLFQAVSAGARPSGTVHPLAIETLKRAGLPTETLRSKGWEEFKGQAFDTVITVCDNARESCPVFPGKNEHIHWSVEDPADAAGTEAEKRAVFQKVFQDLERRLRQFMARP